MSPKSLAATWTRRTFLANASMAWAAMASPFSPHAVVAHPQISSAKSFLVCVASTSVVGSSMHDLEAFVVRGLETHLIAVFHSPEPFGAIVLHPTRNVLYAAYDTKEYLGLPGASIAAFAIDESSRAFVLLNRKALTLSATNPRHLSISPDGSTVLVSASTGGAYNSFAVGADGSLFGSPHAIKLTGCGPHPLQTSPRPGFSAFRRSEMFAYACDFGSDRIDHLGFVGGEPNIRSHANLLPGSGPCYLALHPSEQALAIVSQLRPLVTIIKIDPESGQLGRMSHRLISDSARLTYAYFESGQELCVVGSTSAGARAAYNFRVAQPELVLGRTLSTKDNLGFRRWTDNPRASDRTTIATAIRNT